MEREGSGSRGKRREEAATFEVKLARPLKSCARDYCERRDCGKGDRYFRQFPGKAFNRKGRKEKPRRTRRKAFQHRGRGGPKVERHALARRHRRSASGLQGTNYFVLFLRDSDRFPDSPSAEGLG